MVFSEVVDLTTFNVESIAIHSSQGSSSTSRLLTGGTYSPTNTGIAVTVTLTAADLNAIKYDAALAIGSARREALAPAMGKARRAVRNNMMRVGSDAACDARARREFAVSV